MEFVKFPDCHEDIRRAFADILPGEPVIIRLSLFPRSSKKLQRQLSVSAVPNFRNATISHKKLGSFLGAERVFDAPRQTSIPDPLRSEVAEAREAVLGIKSMPTTPTNHRKSIVHKANSEIASPSHTIYAQSLPKVSPLQLPAEEEFKVDDQQFSSSRDEFMLGSDSLSDEDSTEAKQRSQSFSAADSSSGEGRLKRKKDAIIDRDSSRDRSTSVSGSSALTDRSGSTDAGIVAVSEEDAAKEEKSKRKKKKKSTSFLTPQTERKKKHKATDSGEEALSPKKKEKEKEKKKKKHTGTGSLTPSVSGLSSSSLDMPATPELPKLRSKDKHGLHSHSNSHSHSHSQDHSQGKSESASKHSHTHQSQHSGSEAAPTSDEKKRKKSSSLLLGAGSRANSEIDGQNGNHHQQITSPASLSHNVVASSSPLVTGAPAPSSGTSPSPRARGAAGLSSSSVSSASESSSPTTSPLNSARTAALDGHEGVHLKNRGRTVLRKDSSVFSSSTASEEQYQQSDSSSPALYASATPHGLKGASTPGSGAHSGPSTPRGSKGVGAPTHTNTHNTQGSYGVNGGSSSSQRSPPNSTIFVVTSPVPTSGTRDRSQSKGSQDSSSLSTSGINLGDLSDLKEMLDEIHLPADHISARKGRAHSREDGIIASSPSRGNLIGNSPSRQRQPRGVSSSSTGSLFSSTSSNPIPHTVSSMTLDGRPEREHSSGSFSPIISHSVLNGEASSSPNLSALSRSVDAVSPGKAGGLKNGLGTIYGGGDSLSSDDNPLSYVDDASHEEEPDDDEFSDAIANLRLSEDDLYSTVKRGSRLLMNTRNRSNSLLLQDMFASPSVHTRSKLPVSFDMNAPDPATIAPKPRGPVRQGSNPNISNAAEMAAEATKAATKQTISRSPPPSMGRVPYAEMRSGSFSIDTSSRKAINRDRMAQGSSLNGDDESELTALPEELRLHASRLPIGVRGSMRSTMSPLMKQCRGFWVEVGREHLSPGAVLGDPVSFFIDDAADDKLWYAEYFASHPHFNYVGLANYASGGSSPSSSSSAASQEQFVLSVIRPQSGANMMRVLLRTKRGDERQLVGESKETAKIFKANQVKSKIPAAELMRLIAPSLTNVKMRFIKDLNLIYDLMSFEERLRSKTYKFGILLCKEGQTKEEEMFSNEYGSEHYDSFLNMLGDTIDLKGWEKFRGGLDTTERQATGEKSLYSQYEGNEIMFHVSTMLPFSTDNPQQLERKRHLGNDIVVLVFKEGNTPFLPNTISSEFIHVIAVVQPELQNDKVKYRFSIASKDGVPPFSPPLPATGLFDPGVAFRNLILTKLINGERAAYKAPAFSGKFQRTRQIMLKELDAKYK